MNANSQPTPPESTPHAAVNPEIGGAPIFPWDAVVGIVNDADAVDRVVEQLVAAGFEESAVHVLAGEDGERLIDRSGARHGLLGRVVRKLQVMGEEREHTNRHIDALREGQFLVIVPTKDEDRIQRVREVIGAHGGHFVNYYTRMTTRELTP